MAGTYADLFHGTTYGTFNGPLYGSGPNVVVVGALWITSRTELGRVVRSELGSESRREPAIERRREVRQ